MCYDPALSFLACWWCYDSGECGRLYTPDTGSLLDCGEDKTLASTTLLHFVQGIDTLWRSHFWRAFIYLQPIPTFSLPHLDYDFSPLILNPRLCYINLSVCLKTNKILQVITEVYLYTLCTVETSWP